MSKAIATLGLPASRLLPLLLVGLASLAPVGNTIYLPFIKDIERDFNTTPALVQFTLSAYVLGLSFPQLAGGWLSDRYGRRPVLLAALAIYIIGTLVCYLSPGIATLTAGRFVQGTAASLGPVLARAVVRDIYAPMERQKIFARIAFWVGFVPMAGPLFASLVLSPFGWRSTFGLLFLFSVLLGSMAYFRMWETRPGEYGNPASPLESFKTLLRSPWFMLNTICASAAYATMFTWASSSGFILIGVHHLDIRHFAGFFAFTIAGFVAGSWCASRMVENVGPYRLMLGGFILITAGGSFLVAAALSNIDIGIVATTSVIAAMMVGVGVALPQSVILVLKPFGAIAGTASALTGFVQMAASSGIATLPLSLGQDVYLATNLTMLVLGALGTAAAWRIWQRHSG